MVCSDPEGGNIKDTYDDNDNKDSEIIVLGDIMDSTVQGLSPTCYDKYKIYNIRNLLFIREKQRTNQCKVFLGNRDLMKLKITLLSFDYQGIFRIDSYETLFEYINTNYKKQKNITNPQYLLNLNSSHNDKLLMELAEKSSFTWFEVFKLLFGSVGAIKLLETIYLEILQIFPSNVTIIIQTNILTDKDNEQNYKSCLIIILFRVMLKPRIVPILPETDLDFLKDISFDYIIHLLYDIFNNEHTNFIDRATHTYDQKECIFSHGGITKYIIHLQAIIAFIKKEYADANMVYCTNYASIIKYISERLNILTEILTTNEELTELEKSFSFNEININLKNLLKSCINVEYDKITNNKPICELLILLILGTELEDTFFNLPNNYFSPIGPGFTNFIEKYNIGIKKTIQFMGHKPISISNSIYNNADYIYICTDTSNTYFNSKLNNCELPPISKNYILLECEEENPTIINKMYTRGVINSSFSQINLLTDIMKEIEDGSLIKTIETYKSKVLPASIPIYTSTAVDIQHINYSQEIDFKKTKYFIRLNDEHYCLYLCKLDNDIHLYVCVCINCDYSKRTPIFIIGLTDTEHTHMQDDVGIPFLSGGLHFKKYLKYKYKYLHYIKK